MITLPSSILTELHKLQSDGSVIYLIEIITPSGTLRLARNTEDIVWDSHTWTKSWFTIDVLTESTSGEVPELWVNMSNIGGLVEQQIIAYNNLIDSTCVLYFVNTNCLTETEPILSMTLDIAKVACTRTAASMKLTALNPFSMAYPQWRLHGAICQYPTYDPDVTSPFHDLRCGYTGAIATCDRTLGDCLTHGNYLRFGAQLGIYKEIPDVG
jgi:hypothetical protein